MPEQGRVAEPAITPNPPVNPSTGKRCGVHTRCSRSPQKYREWLAWYPYCAHPASSERRAVSRERPEDAADVGRADERASVGHGQLAAARDGAGADPDVAGGVVVPDRVFDQVRDEAFGQHRIA